MSVYCLPFCCCFAGLGFRLFCATVGFSEAKPRGVLWFISVLVCYGVFFFKESTVFLGVKRGGLFYFVFLNFMCPSGVVRMYVKSCLSSSSALFWSVVLSTIHSPLWSASRCKYFCVVSSLLCPVNCLTISAFCVLLSCFVT